MRNSMRRKGGPSDGAAALGGRRRSPFAQLVPKMAEGLRANGCAHVETGIIRAALHPWSRISPEAVADLIERYASLHSH